MTTVIKEAGGGITSVLLALILVAVVGFIIYAFSSGMFNAPKSDSIDLKAPGVKLSIPAGD